MPLFAIHSSARAEVSTRWFHFHGDLHACYTGLMVARRFHILFEDEALLIVHKGPGLLSVPDRTANPALSRELEACLRQRDGTTTRIYPIHRLDKDVSGILLFAKTTAARDALLGQFEENKPERLYLACVGGAMRPAAGTLRSYLDTTSDRPRSVAPGRGVLAVTHYRTLASTGRESLLEVRLETGRKNQIRVHLSEAGHALLGDRKFGGEERLGFDRRRIALHAYRIRFKHPLTGTPIEVTDPAPPAFARTFPIVQSVTAPSGPARG